MGLKDKLVRVIALRYLRGKIEKARSDEGGMMGKVLKFLDGWKLLIGVAVLFALRVWDAAHNGHTGQFVGSILAALGWVPAGDVWTGESMTAAVASTLAVWGFVHKLYKAQQQARAGAAPSELLSDQGHVAKYIDDGRKG